VAAEQGLVGLAAYLAGRDTIIDAGEQMRGIVAAPTRPSFASLATMDAPTRAAFVTNVIDRLDALATATEGVRDALDAIPADANDPFVRELRDGVAVDAARARFSAAAWRAAERFASEGRYEDAAHALYHGVLLALARTDRVRLDPSKTSGDYARDLRARRSASYRPFRDFSRRFDVAVFGHGGCDAALIDDLRRLATPFAPRARAA
jgi:hypothetical protein